MKCWIVLLLLATPATAAPRAWWQAPPEVTRAVQARMAQLFIPFRDRPQQEQFQFRDRQGVLWLTMRRVGDDVREFNIDGRLICHGWRQGRQFVVWALSPDGHWHRAY